MKIGYLMQQGVNIRQRPFDGPGNHVRQVIEELKHLGHEVRVLLNLDGQIMKTDNLEDFETVSVRWMSKGPLRVFERGARRIQYELKLPYLGLFESLRFALACYQELSGCDLLYERISWLGYGGGWAANWLKIPLVLEENGDQLADLEARGIAPRGIQKQVTLNLMHRAMKRASYVVATGDGWRAHFIKRWNYNQDRIITVENGTEIVRLLNRAQLRSFQMVDSSDQSTTIVYLGGFYAWHGVSVLLSTLARAIEQGVKLKVVLIGSGYGEDEARKLASDLKINDFVTFTGRLSVADFAPIMANADIGVAPYCGWKEFSGLKLLDYKAAGLAVIASGKDGQPSCLKHGQTGWIVPPCDEEALLNAIIHLSKEVELRRQMGQTARFEAESCHGWDHTAQHLDHLFTRIVEK